MMKAIAALCVIALVAYVYGETCTHPGDCHETQCNQNHGWWLHCQKGVCVCNHDTYTGHPCPDGSTQSCIANHGTKCQDNNLTWTCLDNVCHCSKYTMVG
ncbi:hypothetical protein ACF0H5_020770 [Mactra antiquata]